MTRGTFQSSEGDPGPQRPMRRHDGSTDPEAKNPVSLRTCFKGCFADDMADLAWRITCKEYLHRCHDVAELRDPFDDAILYWAKRDKKLYGAVVWPSLIRDKTWRGMVDAKRKASRRSEHLKQAEGELGDFDDGSYQMTFGEVQALEARDLIVDAFRRRYPDPVDRFVMLACIPQLHGETVAARAGDRTVEMYDMRHEVEQVCGDTDAALAFAARTAAEVAAVLYIERPAYRDLEHVQVILQWFVAARRLLEKSNDIRIFKAYWLIEWGWKFHEAHRIAGIHYDPKDRRLADRYRKASQRFSNDVKRDARKITLSVDVLESYVPRRRAI